MRRKLFVFVGAILLIIIIFTVMNNGKNQTHTDVSSSSPGKNTAPLITGPQPTSHVPDYLHPTRGVTP